MDGIVCGVTKSQTRLSNFHNISPGTNLQGLHFKGFALFLTICAAADSSPLAWKIPWTEEPGGLQSMESLGVGHD